MARCIGQCQYEEIKRTKRDGWEKITYKCKVCGHTYSTLVKAGK